MRNFRKTLLGVAMGITVVLGSSPAATADPVPTYTQTTDSWALARLTQTGPVTPGQTSFTYTTYTQGEGVDAYVIDAGVDINHPDFSGRASVAYDPFNVGPNDCTGHGTGVAENLGGDTYGVAKKVRLLSVNTQSCSGAGGSVADWVNAINWVADHHDPSRPSVAVISHSWPGAGYFGLFNELAQAVNNLSQHNVFVAVAAGNVGSAVTYSFGPFWVTAGPNVQRYAVENPPANSGQALIVMGSAPNDTVPLGDAATPGCGTLPDTFKGWSAVGGDLYAPGFPVKTIKELPNAHNSPFISDCGTSYAAPMAAGVAALYKATYGETPSPTVKAWIIAHATQGAITNNPPQEGTDPNTITPNRLLNTGGL